jgi:hypothetical protein
MFWRRRGFLFARRRPLFWGCGTVTMIALFTCIAIFFCRTVWFLR